MAQAFYILQKAVKLSLRKIIRVKTDCIVAHVLEKVEDVMRKLSDVQFRQLPNLKWSYEPPLFGERRILLEPLRMAAIDSCDPVFRFCTGGPLLGACKLPDIPEAQTFDPPEFEDLDEEQAKEMALRGQSVLILGVAGAGKTYFTKEIVRELREQGKQVIVIARTHAAVQNADGTCTANRFCGKYVKNRTCSADTIVVEEVGLIDAGIWADLGKLQMLDKQWILVGDFNQFGPICNHWKGEALGEDVFERSNFLRKMCPFRVMLTENRRSDRDLFAWYTSLIPGGSRYNTPMADVLKEARSCFPVKPGRPRYTLCISHSTRIAVNKAANIAEKRLHTEGILL